VTPAAFFRQERLRHHDRGVLRMLNARCPDRLENGDAFRLTAGARVEGPTVSGPARSPTWGDLR
jgi:hypothetical protein